MAIRQYVGARYVPKFYQGSNGNEWDAGVAYEALTVVSYLNCTYTSKKPVPARSITPNLDTEYWIMTSSLNAEILEMKAEIEAFESKYDFYERKFLFVGDSYGSQTNTWVTPCVDAMGVTNYENISVSGSAFYDNTFKSQLENYTGDKDEVTDIVVGGGLNDARFTSIGAEYNATVSGIEAFATYAKANYPNARLWLAFMGNALDDALLLSGRTWDKRQWAKWCYENKGRENGFIIIKGADEAYATTTSNFESDHIHPSSNGAKVIGTCVANGIMNGESIAIYPYYNTGISAIGNNVVSGSTNVKYSIENGMVNIDVLEAFSIQIGIDYSSFTSSSKIDLVTMSNLYFNKEVRIPVMGRLDRYNSKSFQNVPMVLVFYQNKISAYVDSINSAGSAFETYTAVGDSASVSVQRGVTFSVPVDYVN